MPTAHVGQRVQVNIGGLQTPGVSVTGNVGATGTITALNPAAGLITVRLDVSFSGQNTVTVTPDRVSALV